MQLVFDRIVHVSFSAAVTNHVRLNFYIYDLLIFAAVSAQTTEKTAITNHLLAMDESMRVEPAPSCKPLHGKGHGKGEVNYFKRISRALQWSADEKRQEALLAASVPDGQHEPEPVSAEVSAPTHGEPLEKGSPSLEPESVPEEMTAPTPGSQLEESSLSPCQIARAAMTYHALSAQFLVKVGALSQDEFDATLARLDFPEAVKENVLLKRHCMVSPICDRMSLLAVDSILHCMRVVLNTMTVSI